MTDLSSTAAVFQTGHIGLNVSNLQRSLRFYQEVFGFEVTGKSEEAGREYAFLNQRDTIILTLWQQSTGDFDKGLPGLHHLSFSVPSIGDVKEAQSRVVESGGELLYGGVVGHSEGAQSGGIFFTDPDGIRLEIFTTDVQEPLSAPVTDAPTCGFF